MSEPNTGKETDKNVLTPPLSDDVSHREVPPSKTERTEDEIADDQLDSVAGGAAPTTPSGGPVPIPYPNRQER